MLFTSFTEVVSIGAVIPFLGALSNPDALYESDLIKYIALQFGAQNSDDILLPLTVIFILAALIAGMMRMLLLWAQIKLSYAIGADISYEIYKKTLYQPYKVHMERNSSEVISGISTKANQVVGGTVEPILIILSSSLMLSMMTITLVVINPLVSLSLISGFILIYVVCIGLTRYKLLKNSKKISQQSNQVIKVLQEGLGGIRDILIDGSQAVYCKAFRKA